MVMNDTAQESRGLSDLSQEERLRIIYSDQWIGYGVANRTLATLESMIEHPRRVRMPNFLIIGPTNNGKTMIIEKFRRMHPPSISPGRRYDVIPVVALQMPSEPTTSRFYSAILNSINMPDLGLRTAAAFEQTAIRTLKYICTKILIIDEIHNLLTGSVAKQREFLNLLRFIGNELQVPIVAAGTKDAYLAIRTDPQLENRFEPIVLQTWKDDVEFARLLASFVSIMPLKKPSNIRTKEARRLILERTEGTIGEIATLIRRAAALAITSQQECIDFDLLSSVDYLGPTARRRVYEGIKL
jgi:hypothetical protein